jgi:alpha-galactosidase
VLDRHAASVLTLRQIRSMVDDLIDAHGDAMPRGVRREPVAAALRA